MTDEPLAHLTELIKQFTKVEGSCLVWTAQISPVGVRSFRRLLYESLHFDIPVIHRVQASCRNNFCVNINHLYCVDIDGMSYETEQRRLSGNRGGPRGTLDMEKAKAIRADAATGKYRLSEMAKKYGVTDQMIRFVLMNINHYDPEYTPVPYVSPKRCRMGHDTSGADAYVIIGRNRICRQCQAEQSHSAMAMTRKEYESGFWELVNQSAGPDKCWPYIGDMITGVPTPQGPRTTSVHRVAYALFYGMVPKDCIVVNTCKMHNCVNIDHLKLKRSSRVLPELVINNKVENVPRTPSNNGTGQGSQEHHADREASPGEISSEV